MQDPYQKVEQWMKRARGQLNSYYLAFGGTQWNAFDVRCGEDEEPKRETDDRVPLFAKLRPAWIFGSSKNSNENNKSGDDNKARKDKEIEKEEDDRSLLLAKICFAMFGPPQNENPQILNQQNRQALQQRLCDSYSDEQKAKATQVMQQIIKVHDNIIRRRGNEASSSPVQTGSSNGVEQSRLLLMGIIFVMCSALDETEFCLPIFCIFADDEDRVEDASAARHFVDTFGRTYSSWDDWKLNNTLPRMKYCYPRRGYFTAATTEKGYVLVETSPRMKDCDQRRGYSTLASAEKAYVFDEKRQPDLEFGDSPSCNISFRIFGYGDVASSLTALGSGAIFVASMFTPIWPSILLGSAIGGGSSAVYGAGRAFSRLWDKVSHCESLTDIESLTLYLSIAATPLNFTASLMNGALARNATQGGKLFSRSTQMFATILNFSTLGVDGALIGFGFANLIEKYYQKQMSTLDVLQFSMSVFFFTNTLIKPKFAHQIIENAQDAHIQQSAKRMTNPEVRAVFERFIADNKGDGSISQKAKIVRSINLMNDPNAIFGDAKNAVSIKIGGKKGGALHVTDSLGQKRSINTSYQKKNSQATPAATPVVRNDLSTFPTNDENAERQQAAAQPLDIDTDSGDVDRAASTSTKSTSKPLKTGKNLGKNLKKTSGNNSAKAATSTASFAKNALQFVANLNDQQAAYLNSLIGDESGSNNQLILQKAIEILETIGQTYITFTRLIAMIQALIAQARQQWKNLYKNSNISIEEIANIIDHFNALDIMRLPEFIKRFRDFLRRQQKQQNSQQ